MRKLILHLRRTWKNKLTAVAMIAGGAAAASVDGDGTAFVLLLMFALPLFAAKENYIGGRNHEV